MLDRDAVIHLVDAEDLAVAVVRAELVVLAHDERLHRPRRADLGAEPAEAAAREVEVEVVEDLDLLSGLAVAAERDQVVGTGLRALIADDAGRGAGFGLDLKAEQAAEARRDRTALRRVLKGEGGLRRVARRDQQPLDEVDEED